MTAIYTVYKGIYFVGRCDARCHNAKGHECRCVCGGAHHGIGTKAAIEDRQNVSDDELVAEATIIYGPGNYHIARTPQQMEMFA